MRKLSLLLLSLTFVCSCAVKTTRELKKNGREDELTLDDSATANEPKKSPVTAKKEDEETPPPPAARIENAELKKLSDARKSKSEVSIVRVASEILAKDSRNLEALNTLGVFYAETKRFGIAKTIFRRAMKDHPDVPALHNNLGVIYLAENEPQLALESFRKAIQLKSNYRIGASNLASIYLEHRDYTRSLSPLEDSYSDTKSDLSRGSDYAVQIANNYAVALMGTGENSKAEDVFEKILTSNTRRVEPYFNYSILLVEVLKKKKDALRVLSKLKLMTEEREVLRQVDELEKKVQQ